MNKRAAVMQGMQGMQACKRAERLNCKRTRSLDSSSFFTKAACAACSCARVTHAAKAKARACELRNLGFLACLAGSHSLLKFDGRVAWQGCVT